MKDAQKPDHISINNMIARLGIRGTPSGGCAPRAPLGRRGFWFGQRPSSAEGLAWPAPLSRPLRPPTFSRTGGHPLYPRRGLRPLHPAWGRDGGFLTVPAGQASVVGVDGVIGWFESAQK